MYAPLYSSISWILPVSYVIYKNNEKLEISTCLLLFLMIIMTVFSCLFWTNKNTLIHTLDAGCARLLYSYSSPTT